jgi:hypothetical protein
MKETKCIDCGEIKKSHKSLRCHSCARIVQHADGCFDYVTDNDIDFKKSWALNNLQPKWEIPNCSKGNRFSEREDKYDNRDS